MVTRTEDSAATPTSPGAPTTGFEATEPQTNTRGPNRRRRTGATQTDTPSTQHDLLDTPDMPERPPRPTLRDKLPEGVYDDRPRIRRYVLHWVYFWAYALLRLDKLGAPRPRPHAQELIARGFDELFELARTRQPIIACLNSKGGSGKTVVSTWLSVLIKLATKRPVYIVDANENKGNTASRLGIDRNDTVRLRDFLRYDRELSTATALNQALGSHPVGVLVVASDPDKRTYFTQPLFEQRIRTLSQAGHTVVLDAGNGIPHAANRGSAQIADVLVFPATVMQADSFEDARDTRNHYAANERHYGFGDKVDQGVIVLLGVSEKERLILAERYQWNLDKVFVVPKDPFMVGKHIVDWNRIRPRTQAALIDVAVEIFRTAPKVDPWDLTTDNNQHADELDLTEIEYAPPSQGSE